MLRGTIPDPVARQPWQVILPLFALTTFGATVLYSAAGGSLRPWALTHFLRFFVFLGMAVAISRVRKETFKSLAYPIYGVIVVLLVLVELVGGIGGGSQRWLNLGFMTLQPSELMKPGIVLVLARFYDDLPASMTASWRALIPAATLLAVPAGLVIIQPDLGTGLAITFGATVVV
ncbi:MAG TPA: FtsW/RodA/SpoVE family cell cycle protein, partial [Novosphingobium sp.]|nr:FtsW/RodA/SpoVE family cell cycle protein [Novosphingobium sp.]